MSLRRSPQLSPLFRFSNFRSPALFPAGEEDVQTGTGEEAIKSPEVNTRMTERRKIVRQPQKTVAKQMDLPDAFCTAPHWPVSCTDFLQSHRASPQKSPAAGNPLVNLLPAERDADGRSSDPPGYVPEEYRVFFLKYRRSAQLRRFLCRQLSSLDLSADGDGIRFSDRRPDSHYQPGVSDDSVACGGKTVRPIFPVPALFRRNGNLRREFSPLSLSGNFPISLFLAALVVIGIGFALFSSPNTNAIMACVDKKDYGVASSVTATSRSIGHTLSMAVVNRSHGGNRGKHHPELRVGGCDHLRHAGFFYRIYTAEYLSHFLLVQKKVTKTGSHRRLFFQSQAAFRRKG